MNLRGLEVLKKNLKYKVSYGYLFQASVNLLYHPTEIQKGFRATVHVGNIRQTAFIESIQPISKMSMNNDHAEVVFRFIRYPEYVKPGSRLLFREGRTKGMGTVTEIEPYEPNLNRWRRLPRHPRRINSRPPPSMKNSVKTVSRNNGTKNVSTPTISTLTNKQQNSNLQNSNKVKLFLIYVTFLSILLLTFEFCLVIPYFETLKGSHNFTGQNFFLTPLNDDVDFKSNGCKINVCPISLPPQN